METGPCPRYAAAVTDRARGQHTLGVLRTRRDRRLVSGAMWGPALFIAAWVVGGLLLVGYSPIQQHISDLAAVGASTQELMTLGFVAFGIGVGSAAWPLRRLIGKPSALALVINAALMVGIALTPTGGSADIDFVHAMLALLLYISISVAAPLAAIVLRRRGNVVALVSLAVGLATLAFLSASLGESSSGLLQRLGLTITDVWLVVIALGAVSGRFREDDTASTDRPGQSGTAAGSSRRSRIPR
jgi:hypothetical membrane protein